MSSRYLQTMQIKDQKGIRRAETWINPTPISNSNDTYIITTTPERLDKLAYDFYDDVQLWWLIAAVNGLGKGTLVVPGNTKLRIPSKDGIQELAKQLNEER